MVTSPASPERPKRDRSRRSRWTPWIVLGGTIAVGGGFLLAMDALTQVGRDMSQLVRDSAPLGAPRAQREPPVDRAAPAHAPGRVAAESERIRGRVVIPAGTPETEVAWVELDVPAAPNLKALHERTRVRDDGAFEFELGELSRGAVVRLDARFLYLEEPVVVAEGEERRPIELRPKLGAHLEGRCVLDPEHDRLSAWIVGSVIELRGPGRAEWDAPLRVARIDRDLCFELRGVPGLERLDPLESAKRHHSGGPGNVVHIRSCTPFLDETYLVSKEVQQGATASVELYATLGISIAGRVVDEVGRPVDGATLGCAIPHPGVWNVGRGREETDEQGRFELIGLPHFVRELTVRHEEFQVLEHELRHLEPDERREGLVLVLSKAHSIAGRVLWPDGMPAWGATVAADPEVGAVKELFTTIADDEGAFRIDGVLGTRFRVTARATIPSVLHPGGNVIPGRRGVACANFVAADESALELRLGAGVSLRGRILDGHGAPCTAFAIAAAPVIGGETLALPAREVREGFRGEDGRFELAGLHPGAWSVHAEYGGFRSKVKAVELDDSGAWIEIVLALKPSLSGRVLDPQGNPVPRAWVWFDRLGLDSNEIEVPGDGKVRADAQGRFQFEFLGPGRIALQAQDPDVGRARPKDVEVPREGHVEVGELMLIPPASLACSVVDETGLPIPNARVALWPLLQGVSGTHDQAWDLSDAGRVAAHGLAPGHYRLRVQARGFAGRSITLSLPSKEAEDLRVVLARGALLRVIHVGPAAERASCFVIVRDERGSVVNLGDEDPPDPREDDLLVARIVPGRYVLVLKSKDGRKATRELVISSLEPVTVEMKFER